MVSKDNRIMMMGSCFSTEIGRRLLENGYKVSLNPFGILFNPSSIASSIERMDSGRPFTEEDVVERVDDARLGLKSYVSFAHHGCFARSTKEEFLAGANESLRKAVEDFKEADTLILTFGTAWVFRHSSSGLVVSNCHKIPQKEFVRQKLEISDIVDLYRPLILRHRDKRWIFTVSPIRHKADGWHGNQLSKATLLLAIEQIQKEFADCCLYFPSYEIMIDELRDYRYYNEDGSHPSEEAANLIFERFV